MCGLVSCTGTLEELLERNIVLTSETRKFIVLSDGRYKSLNLYRVILGLFRYRWTVDLNELRGCNAVLAFENSTGVNS